MTTTRRDLALDAALLGAARLAVSAWVLSHGFSHVSDDDYARTVIAESFAHAPRFDPSGTSWLPFPFWLTGTAMLVLGRTLVAARAAALFASALGVVGAHVALRGLGVPRVAAAVATALAMSTPWAAWSGAAAVPEGFVGALVAIGLFAAARGDAGGRPDVLLGGALAVLAASLSRYEAWPACAVLAVCLAIRALRSWRRTRASPRERALLLAVAALSLLGPLGWITWNLHAHGSATHFLHRVASYRHALGEGDAPLAERLAFYPRALFEGAWEIAVLGAAGLIASIVSPEHRARFAPSMIGGVATALFLVVGELQGGAPTHHAVRAWIVLFVVLAASGVDALRIAARRIAWGRSGREAWVAAATAGAFIAWLLVLPARLVDAPGRSADEDRKSQIERGESLRAQGVEHVVVTPCAYEHFALIAAFGSPERVEILAPSHAETDGTRECPRVETR